MTAFPTAPAPHGPHARPVGWVMTQVLLALVPGALTALIVRGPGVAVNLALCLGTAYLCEAGALSLRKRPLGPALRDGSVAVTGVLIALSLPPWLPWTLPVLGTAFAVLFAKHLYGGLGQNPFNPAMAAYAFLLVSFPVAMTRWPAAAAVWDGALAWKAWIGADVAWDGLTGATPLGHVRTQLALTHTLSEITEQGGPPGARAGLLLNLAYGAGGLYLLARGIINWRIPLAVLGALALCAFGFQVIDADRYPSALFHLTQGAALLGAFFIATDPVSASTTPRGRLIYGAGIGGLVYLIRTFGAYPDGFAFAVLLMNLAVPLIDRLTIPRPYGTPDDT